MKKILSFALALLLLAGMIGCSKDENDTADTLKADSEISSEKTETIPVSANTEEETSSEDEPSADTAAVSVHTENFMHGECSVTLMYPRYGDGKHDLFDVAMRNHAMQEFNQNGMMPEDSAVYEIISCEIKYESEYFLSAVIEVHIINISAVQDSMFAYTVNADPRNGRIYLSDELIGELDSLKSAFAEGKFKQSLGVDGLMDEVTPDHITESWRSDYGVFPDLYFTGHSLGVVAELPRVLGGYAGFEISYGEAGDMINPTAKGLVGITVTTE